MIVNVGGIALGTAAILGNVVWQQGNSLTCSYDFKNASYSAAQLRTNSFYFVNDNENAANQRNYTYFFNVCANLPTNPNYFALAAVCNTTYAGWNNQNETISTPTMALQYSNPKTAFTDQCHRLSGPAEDDNIQWALIDPENPAFGFIMQYLNGDKCFFSDGRPPASRSLRLWLICDNDDLNVPDDEVVLESVTTCVYDIYIKSLAGCPSECPAPFVSLAGGGGGSRRMLCGGHGVCGFDGAAGKSRCFCNGGWAGDDCTSTPSAPPATLSPVAGVLIGVGILLALLIAGLGYLWLRIRALRLDPTAYSSLRGGPEEAGGFGGSAEVSKADAGVQ